MQSPPKKSLTRTKSSIKKDVMNPSDFLRYDFRFACEECSHFDSITEICTIGYVPSHHRRAEQERQYHLSGRMALCRFHEID